MKLQVAVFAHNEERRIRRCIDAILGQYPSAFVHVLENGSSDATAQEAVNAIGKDGRGCVHQVALGDKANAWNRFVHEFASPDADLYIFCDGDCYPVAGSVAALVEASRTNERANAFSALPATGRDRKRAIAAMISNHDLAGNLYALSRSFMWKLRGRQIRLPVGIVGDDSLVGAIAKMNASGPDAWSEEYVSVCQNAFYAFDPVSPLSFAEMEKYVMRLERYARRSLEIQMLQEHHRRAGLEQYPESVQELYRRYYTNTHLVSTGMPWLSERMAHRRILAIMDSG